MFVVRLACVSYGYGRGLGDRGPFRTPNLSAATSDQEEGADDLLSRARELLGRVRSGSRTASERTRVGSLGAGVSPTHDEQAEAEYRSYCTTRRYRPMPTAAPEQSEPAARRCADYDDEGRASMTTTGGLEPDGRLRRPGPSARLQPPAAPGENGNATQ